MHSKRKIDLREWVTITTSALIVSWLGWVSITLIELKTDVARLNYIMKLTAAPKKHEPTLWAMPGLPMLNFKGSTHE